MNEDFERVLEELDKVANAVTEHSECPKEIGKLTFAFLIKLHETMAELHKRAAAILAPPSNLN